MANVLVRNTSDVAIPLKSHCGDTCLVGPKAKINIEERFTWMLPSEIVVVGSKAFPKAVPTVAVAEKSNTDE